MNCVKQSQGMGQLFNSNTQVVYYEPSTAKYGKTNKWILWPVIAYKVMVPYPRQKDLNLFQETILRLFELGINDTNIIAHRLSLNPDLVEFIVKQLRGLKLISELKLTDAAKAILQDDDDIYQDRIGYVFYDCIGQFYWDFFAAELQLTDFDTGYMNRVVRTGDIGNPIVFKALVVNPQDMCTINETPDNLKIMETIIRHKRRISRISKIEGDDTYINKRLTGTVERVRYLNSRLPVFIATRFTRPTLEENVVSWHICHPFGGGISNNLKEMVLRLNNDPAYSQLKFLCDSILKEVAEESIADIKNKREKGASAAEVALTRIFSERIYMYTYLLEASTSLITNFASIKEDSFQDLIGIKTKLERFADSAYKVLSEALYCLYSTNRSKLNIGNLFPDTTLNAQLMVGIAKNCGFNESSQLYRFLAVKIGMIRYLDDAKQMQGLIAANLLIAMEMPDHPFYAISEVSKDFLLWLKGVREIRNIANHSDQEGINFKDVKSFLYSVLKAIYILLPDLTFNYRDNFNEIAQDYFLGARLLAEQNIGNEFGELKQLSLHLNDLLIDAEYEAIVSTKNKEDELLPESSILGLSKICEELLNLIYANVDHQNPPITATASSLTETLIRRIEILGFDPIPAFSSIRKINNNKVEYCLKDFSKSTLEPRLICLFGGYNKDNLIKQIAQKEAGLVNFMVSMSNKRGHHGIKLSPKEYMEHYHTVKELIKSIISILGEKQDGEKEQERVE